MKSMLLHFFLPKKAIDKLTRWNNFSKIRHSSDTSVTWGSGGELIKSKFTCIYATFEYSVDFYFSITLILNSYVVVFLIVRPLLFARFLSLYFQYIGSTAFFRTLTCQKILKFVRQNLVCTQIAKFLTKC